MAEDISGICREYVGQNYESVADMEFDDAAKSLTDGARQKLREVEWSDTDYGVDVDELVRQELTRIRG